MTQLPAILLHEVSFVARPGPFGLSLASSMASNRVVEVLGYSTCTESTGQGNDNELIPTINKCPAVTEMGDRLVTIDMGEKLGAVPLFWEGTGSPCNTMWLGPSLPSYQVASILGPSNSLATTDMGRKSGAVPLGGEAGSAPNTMLLGSRPIFIPSGILIHPAVCRQ